MLGAALHPIAIEPAEHFPADLEVRHRLLVHLDRLVGARIAPDAGGALFYCEGSEPTQLDALAARQSGGDLVEDRRDVSSASAVRRCGWLAASSVMSSALVNAGFLSGDAKGFPDTSRPS